MKDEKKYAQAGDLSMELKQNLITRAMTPHSDVAKYPIFHDVKIQASKKLRAAVFKITDLARIANDDGEVAFDATSLHGMLEAVDAAHTYPKTPTQNKRWEDEPIWKLISAGVVGPTDPLGQRARIEYMGKVIGSLTDDGKFVPADG